ncbi:MAG: N-acetylmuramoyl-L-alanine amidase [Verrucomicrobiae bacterium]|nr:N-acetylmuramoyl-L-alanine amidase [Verrucomicrobiae bacterium]NNJ41931.1 hypothetical protein [Akkermansiaceae bacterium]
MPDTSSHRRKPSTVSIILLLLLIAAGAYIMIQHEKGRRSSADSREGSEQTDATVTPALPSGHDTTLADLGNRPDWSTLDLWQETITREDFLRLLTEVYTVDDTWKRYIEVYADHAIIRTDTRKQDMSYRLNFAHSLSDASPHRNWNAAGDLAPGTKEKPLAGVHIAIDPGHIGGEFAKTEGRWFQIGDNAPIKEGEMTLATGKLIKKKLIALGAKVYLVRGSNKPVNPRRPAFYRDAAVAKSRSLGKLDEETIQQFQNKFFYRTGEIRERARRVNLAFSPDLVLCLHYNAEAWDDPTNPTLTSNNHYHVLLHGALTREEIAHDDERFEMLVKILQQTHDEEKPIGMYVAHALGLTTGLPAYEYTSESTRAIRIPDVPGLWARNLLANRLYQCPVIFLEPYVMNNQDVHDRVQLGIYEGTKTIHGAEKKSIYHEYADAVVLALKEYYLAHRIIYQSEDD